MNDLFSRIAFDYAGRHIANGRTQQKTLTLPTLELIYVQRGTLHLWQDQSTFQIFPGERIYLFPRRQHGGMQPYKKGMTFFWMHVYLPDMEAERFFESQPRIAKLASEDFFNEYVRILLSAQRRCRLNPTAHNSIQLNALAAIILRESLQYAENVSGVRTNSLIDFTKQYIEDHYMEACETSDIARISQCHKDYLSRIFSNFCGQTIGAAVRKKRIQRACSLLEDTNICIKEIASQCGYNDVSYFRRQFFRECAMTPKAYRLLHQSA